MIEADIDLLPFDEHVARRLILGCKDFLSFRDGGVWPTQHSIAHVVNGSWKPCDELPAESAASTADAPALPVPFTAGQLAAFMVDGPGRSISEYFGEIDNGLEELVLAQFQEHELRVAQAIVGAFLAYREAAALVGRQRLTKDRTLCPAWRRSLIQYLLSPSTLPNRRLTVTDTGTVPYGALAESLTRAQWPRNDGLSVAVREKALSAWREILDDAAEADQLIVREPRTLTAQPFENGKRADQFVVTAADLVSYLKSQGGLSIRIVSGTGRTNSRVQAVPLSNWKSRARERAAEIIFEQSARDLYPSQEAIADQVAREFREAGIAGDGGKPLAGSYIKRHALKGISSSVRRSAPTPV
ncbi:hypothetical protein [Variovorax sp.]|uniref:hypothetical protein n=1 Tax=Variovorax sp. TaxID=1871043 RepID=UPI0025CD175D|nr:hypothetical protein [Variovorax sp.]